MIHEGDSLPSVRQLADTIGVNMHTVNKAYSVLKREGYISLDKRRGAVIALDVDKMEQLEEMRARTQDCACTRMLQKYFPSGGTRSGG